jgi:hypothetical protein
MDQQILVALVVAVAVCRNRRHHRRCLLQAQKRARIGDDPGKSEIPGSWRVFGE